MIDKSSFSCSSSSSSSSEDDDDNDDDDHHRCRRRRRRDIIIDAGGDGEEDEVIDRSDRSVGGEAWFARRREDVFMGLRRLGVEDARNRGRGRGRGRSAMGDDWSSASLSLSSMSYVERVMPCKRAEGGIAPWREQAQIMGVRSSIRPQGVLATPYTLHLTP